MDAMLIGALLLLLLGLGLVVLEVFIPSGGILGVLSGTALVAAVVMGFLHNVWTGAGVVGGIIIALPLSLAAALHFWPHTPMGKRIMLGLPNSEDVLPDNPERQRLKSLVGQLGRAKSLMLPSGGVTIDGRTVDAVTEGMAVEAGQWVRVVEVRGNRVVVRPTEERPPNADRSDLLARPIDAIGADPFQEPLA